MLCLVAMAAFGRHQKIDNTPKETPVLPQFYQRPTKGPSLSEVQISVPVKGASSGSSSDVLIPAPSDYSGQLTVSLKVQCDPPSALASWKLMKRPDGLNWVISASLKAGVSSAVLSYRALVLCPGEAVYRTQVSASKPWLAASSTVQSKDTQIVFVSRGLKQGTEKDEDFVRKVVLWVARNQTGAGLDSPADALDALKSGGGSAGRASLCAAILRASGIAARTVSYMPIWATDRIEEQWLTQYWSDEGNWEPVDPTVGLMEPARNSMVVLSISSVADENRASFSGRAVWGAAGAPYLSVPELPLGSASSGGRPLQVINLFKRFPHQFGGRLMTAGYRRSLKVLAAAERGESLALEDSVVLQAMAKNPGNLAFLFDKS